MWNALAIAALEDHTFASALFKYLHSFSFSYSSSLQHLPSTSSASVFDSTPADVSQAYTAIKLWLLAARIRNLGIDDAEESVLKVDEDVAYAERRVWNAVWPSFERILGLTAVASSDDVSVSCAFRGVQLSSAENTSVSLCKQ